MLFVFIWGLKKDRTATKLKPYTTASFLDRSISRVKLAYNTSF
jgi:hypothetical protein